MDYDFLSVSDGTGDASLMHIGSTRLSGATTIDVDTVVGVSDKFIGTYGDLLASGFLDPATKRDFIGHVDGGNLEIDDFEPGSIDEGNVEGQVVIVKPTTGWANRVASFIQNATGFGTPETLTAGGLTISAGTITVPNNSIAISAINNPYRFSAYCSTGKPVTNGNWLVDLQTEVTDPNNNFSSSRYTAPVSGDYQLSAQIWVGISGLSTTEGCAANILKNGTSLPADSVATSSTLVGTGNTLGITKPSVSKMVYLAAGDWIELWLGTNATRDIVAGARSTYMTGHLVHRTA